MKMRPRNALIASALIAGLTAGCASSSGSASSSPASSPTGTASAANRLGDAAALIVQCTLTQNLMKPPTGLVTPAGQTPFVTGTKLAITPQNAATFNEWYNGIAGVKVAGQEIGAWVQQTATSGTLPTSVCGSSVTASELQQQVFANDPQAGNPW